MIKKYIRKKMNRSGKERCTICGNTSILVQHHINGRNIDDFNKPWNLANICDNCHRSIHEGKIIIEKWALTTQGNKLLWHFVNEKSTSEQSATPYLIPN